jgi:hypothetical protein
MADIEMNKACTRIHLNTSTWHEVNIIFLFTIDETFLAGLNTHP